MKYLKNFEHTVIPEWSWNIDIELSNYDNDLVLAIIFENSSEIPKRSKTRESYFFEVQATFHFENDLIKPFELDLVPNGFRYDRDMWGRGFNCAVVKKDNLIYETDHSPFILKIDMLQVMSLQQVLMNYQKIHYQF